VYQDNRKVAIDISYKYRIPNINCIFYMPSRNLVKKSWGVSEDEDEGVEEV